MNTYSTASARILNIAGLVVAAVGIVIQIAGGADYPTVPPGLLILLAAAALIYFAPWRWTAIIGVLVPLFLLVGGVIAPNSRDYLGDPGTFGPFIGTIVQGIGIVAALVGGVVVVSRLRVRA